MDQLSKVQKILTESTLIICNNLDPNTLLLTMKTKRALMHDDVKLIQSKVLESKQAELLLDILMKKPATSYDIFMEALLERAERKDLYDQIKAIEMKHEYVTAGTTASAAVAPAVELPSARPFDVTTWQNQLKAIYKTRRARISFIPGLPKKFSSDEFFVELELLEKQELPMKVEHVKLKTYTDLLKLKNTQGNSLDHVLVSGLAGTGKTTLISRLAYQWATLHHSSSKFHKGGGDSPLESNLGSSSESYDDLGKFQLVFALDIKRFEPNQDLIDAVWKQLLPHASREQLESYLSCNFNHLFLFDGFDELSSNDKILSDDMLCGNHIIVTTRLKKTNEFNIKNEGYVQVQLNGFSDHSIELFVKAFVRGSGKNSEEESKQVKILLKEIRKTKATSDLSHFPLLLAIMCIIWNQNKQSLPDTMSALYQKVIKYLVKHCESREWTQQDNVQELLNKLGKVAFHGLVEKNSKLIFEEDDFDQISKISLKIVEKGCTLGLLIKLSTENDCDEVTNVSFIHKTFQEYCAAMYLANLAESDPDLCNTYLSKMDTGDMEYVLKFGCGMSVIAAKVVLSYIVDQSCKRKEDLREVGEEFGIGCKVDGMDPWKLPLILLFEAESQFRLNKLLHELLTPLVSRLSLMNNTISDSEYERALKYFIQYAGTPHAWMSHVEEAHIDTSRHHSEFKLPILMLIRLPHLYALTIKVAFLSNYTPFVLYLQKKMASRSMKDLDFDGECECDIAAIGTFLDTQINLTTVSIPRQPNDEATDVTILGQILREISTRSGLIRKVTLGHKSDGDKCIQKLSLHCHVLEKLVMSSTNITPIGFQTLYEAIITTGRKLQQINHIQDEHKLPLKYLDVLRCNVGDSAYTLAVAMTYMTSLEYLDLSHCKLQEKHFDKLGPAFTHLTNLTTLHLSNTTIGNSFHGVAQGINACKLTKLNLGCANLRGESNNALSIMELPLLTDLSLQGAGVTSDGAVALSKLLKYTELLGTFELGGNMIGSSGAEAISSSFQYIPRLKQLDLSNNNIGSDGAQALSPSLKYITGLTRLVLSDNNIGTGGAQALSAPLQYIPQLDELHLSNNNIGSDGARALSTSLQYIPQLWQLGLSKNNIGSDGAQALSASLQYIPQLTRLFLSDNNIGSDGAQVLSASLQYIPKLYILDLSHNPIEAEGVEEIFKHLAHQPKLQHLYLGRLSGNLPSTANKCPLLQKCIEVLKKSPNWKESSEEYWFNIRLKEHDINAVKEVVIQWGN